MCYKNYGKWGKLVSLLLFILYAAVLLRLTVLRDEVFTGSKADGYRINLKLWDMYEYFLRTGQVVQYRYLLLGNYICLAPLGFACPFFRKDSGVLLALAVCLGTTVFIELWQLVLNVGYFELDDMILNTLGGISGYALFRLTEKALKKE